MRWICASLRHLLAAMLFATALSAPASAETLAKVDGSEITDADVTLAMEDIGPTLPQDMQGPARDAYVLDYLIDLKLVAKAAEADKTLNADDIKRRVAYYHDKAMMESAFGAMAKGVTSEAGLHQVYDEIAKQQAAEPEIHARHILVATEAQAQTALKRVRAGEDFAKVAGELSTDPGSEGGDLGWFTRDQMVPQFADAAFKLQVGQISEPVKSDFGWHIIKLEGKRQKPFPPFDEVRDQVVRYAMQKAQSEMIAKLRQGAKVERVAPAPNPGQPPAPR
jgi:peptidyl-prolyl cis-trans isomerase C